MTITLHPTYATVDPDPQLIARLREVCRYEDPTRPDGYGYLINDAGEFAAGLVPRVRHVCADVWGLPVTLDDHRGEPPDCRVVPTTIPLRDYQVPAYEQFLANPRGILYACPRSGKTTLAAAAIESLPDHRPALFLVERGVLGQQAAGVFQALLGEKVALVGGGNGKLVTDESIIVALRQSLVDLTREPWFKSIRLICGDECHHFGSDDGQYARIGRQLTGCWRWWGLSGTPWTVNGRDLVLEGYFGPILPYRITNQMLCGSIDPKTGCPYVVPQLIVFQRLPRRTYDRDVGWQEVYDDYGCHNPHRDQAICDFTEALTRFGQRTLVTVNRKEHGYALADRLGVPFLSGDDPNVGYRKACLDNLCYGEPRALVSTLCKEAVDLPPLVGVVNAAGLKSSIDFHQIPRNRTGFPGKRLAISLDFDDHAPFLGRWARERRKYAALDPTTEVVYRDDYVADDRPKPQVWDWLGPRLAGFTLDSHQR